MVGILSLAVQIASSSPQIQIVIPQKQLLESCFVYKELQTKFSKILGHQGLNFTT